MEMESYTYVFDWLVSGFTKREGLLPTPSRKAESPLGEIGNNIF